MNEFVTDIFFGDFTEAKEEFQMRMEELIQDKLNSIEERLRDEIFEDLGFELEEDNIQRMGRTKMVRIRIRKGKVQRRVKKSAVKGYTIRGGKLIRMTPQERRHRKVAARRSKFKRRSKIRQSQRKRTIALRKRKAMGLNETH